VAVVGACQQRERDQLLTLLLRLLRLLVCQRCCLVLARLRVTLAAPG
jgi:hypothetical protein